MKQIDIFFDDLSEKKKKELIEIMGYKPWNSYLFSLTIFTKEDCTVELEEAILEKNSLPESQIN